MTTIRLYDPKDEAQCLAMSHEFLQESEMNFLYVDEGKVLSLLRDALLLPETRLCLVSEVDGKLTGSFYGRIVPYYFCDEVMAMDCWVYVKPEHRGTKAATSFIKWFSQWAKEMGAKETMVAPSTGIQTDRTVAWLNRLGFSTSGVMTKKRN